MPFLSARDSREVQQGLTQASFVEEASFGETFAAGVGQVFDEELSVSSMLNMQGFNQRKDQVKELGNSGAFNIDEYTSAVGDVNYEKISKDFPDFKLKDDKTLFDERATLLKSRREYAQDVFDRGNGMAQFLGMATAYMLDPINIATMPIATAGTAVKGLGALGRAITVGRNEAGIAIAAELMIQPLVYQHKHDIKSPFEFKDALLNIVTAATGAAAIGGTVGGISGYLKNVREKTAGLPLNDDAKMSLESMARVEDDLNNIKAAKGIDEATKKRFLDEFDIDLSDPVESVAQAKVKKVVELSKKQKELQSKSSSLGVRANEALDIEDINLANRLFDEKELIKADINKIDSDIKELTTNKIEIDNDAEILTELNNKMQTNNQPSKVKENYIQPERKAATSGSVSQRERAVVERNGLTKDYDADIEAFNKLENPRIVQDDVVVDAGSFMKSIDDEIKGIEEVLTCAI